MVLSTEAVVFLVFVLFVVVMAAFLIRRWAQRRLADQPPSDQLDTNFKNTATAAT